MMPPRQSGGRLGGWRRRLAAAALSRLLWRAATRSLRRYAARLCLKADGRLAPFSPRCWNSWWRSQTLRLPVTQMSFSEAVTALRAAVERGGRRYGAFASGVVRWEVPLPRDANALQWLQVGRTAYVTVGGGVGGWGWVRVRVNILRRMPDAAGRSTSSAKLRLLTCCSCAFSNYLAQAQDGSGTGLLHPRVYFSPRRSPAPNTEGGAAAETAGAGCGAVAGVGAAWLWRGEVRRLEH